MFEHESLSDGDSDGNTDPEPQPSGDFDHPIYYEDTPAQDPPALPSTQVPEPATRSIPKADNIICIGDIDYSFTREEDRDILISGANVRSSDLATALTPLTYKYNHSIDVLQARHAHLMRLFREKHAAS
eukprot:c12267_g1_i3.p1 GENE.c12267_g1_i3~~c12267_g1_i3.p1  ORF type:complete len:129 (+),score=12.24 c12267_g1_i3:200-586(+)